MKISLSWLREFVDFKENASEIADFLSGLGLESEKIDEENINVEITANRGDALSILGLAREISAKLNLPLNLPKPKIEAKKNDYNFKLNFSDEAKKIVPRFTYRILKNIKIGPTPPSLVKKIESYGFRSINNVVDITNLVMIELGQPMHAFDAGKINYNLNLRLSTADEKIITLDGKEHTLKEGSLVGEDNNGRLIDLCGIMGGFYSEVDEKTTNIILQAAIFDPINIRKTSKYLNHTTDASYRYERGVDQDQTILALDRATELILQSSSGEIGKIADIENQKIEKRIITANYDKINNLLGIEFTRE
ncbi:MAG: phenylalanine--tRNA ligase beta subunit-related protein, partial [Patescibacteria group bacterium]|nr:phenylalanine--tRNA ligase beta subunit-related protein [Patescibacteria group bacterium]